MVKPTNVVWFDQKSEDESRTVQSEEENGLVITEDGLFDDEAAEPEVIIRLPRGSDPPPELVLQATPMDPANCCYI